MELNYTTNDIRNIENVLNFIDSFIEQIKDNHTECLSDELVYFIKASTSLDNILILFEDNESSGD